MSGLLMRLLLGYRQVRMRGRRVEVLVSRVISQGYRLWKVERHGDELWALVTEEGFEVAVSTAESLGVEVDTLKRGGLPFRWGQIKDRPFLLVGLATACAMVIYGTSHVWAIKVTAPDLTPQAEAQLVQTAERSGLKVGMVSRRLDVPQIRRAMLAALPEYSWIGIHIHGMVAVIDGIKFVPRPPDHRPPKLVARRSGKVTAVYVYMGAAQVSKGETVQKGQTLISGVVTDVSPVQPKGTTSPQEQSVVTPAEGEVRADVTYRARVFQPFVEKQWVKTGRVVHRRFIEFDRGGVVAIPNPLPIGFSHYTVEKNVSPVHFAGVALPVRMIDLVYNEEVKHTVTLDRRQAVKRGQKRAVAELRKEVPKNDPRVKHTEKVSYTKAGAQITLTWVINSDIAAPPRAGGRS